MDRFDGRRPESAAPSSGGPFLRPARPDELALARAIDDDAVGAYDAIGIPLLLPHDHPFARYEEARWAAALAEGNLLFACTADGTPQGFAACGLVGGRPFLHQISVRTGAARQGLGSLLIERVKRWAIGAARPHPPELWLTTYDHVAFNRPWYQRLGFEVVPEAEAGPEMRAIAEKEREALPAPEQRVLMRWR